MRPIVVDLFSGVGGMSLGFEAAGFDIGASVELDPIHCAAHEFNFPYGAAICKDITEVTPTLIENRLSERGFNSVDVIVGGPPCQGFSQIGKRQLDDPRNQLVFEYLRLVDQLRPKYFVFENVKGIVLGQQKRFVEELVEEFKQIGYTITLPYRVLNAADYGVAQNRHRFILLGARSDQVPLSYPNPTHHALEHPNLLADTHVGSAQVLADFERFDAFTHEDEGILAANIAYSDASQPYHFMPSSLFALCHRRIFSTNTIYGHLVSSHTTESQTRFAATIPGSTEPKSRFFKLHPDRPSNTLRAGTDSGRGAYTAARPVHYEQPRCISIREGARLHSFPDWFQFHRTIWHGFRQIGNAVAPRFAKAIADQIMATLALQPTDAPVRILEAQDDQLVQMTMTEASAYYGVSDHIGKRVRKDEVTING